MRSPAQATQNKDGAALQRAGGVELALSRCRLCLAQCCGAPPRMDKQYRKTHDARDKSRAARASM